MPNLLAVDTSNDLLYSDYYLNNSKLYKLHVIYNWRFYLNCLVDQKYYLSYLDFSKVFNLDGNLDVKEYFINARFTQSNESLNRSFIISNLKHEKFECFNSNETVDNKLKCSAVLIFQKQNQKFLLNKGDCNSLNLTTSGTFYDGYGSIKILNNSLLHRPNTTLTNHFLLSDTIIKFEANLIGYEFFALGSGPILINLWAIYNCDKQSCASFLSESLYFNASKIMSWLVNGKPGFNKIFLDFPFKIVKNFIISIEFISSNKIALFDDPDLIFPDYLINKNYLIKLNNRAKFLFKALIDSGYYIGTVDFTLKYEYIGTYTISIGSTQRFYTVSNNKNMELICPYVVDLDLDCYLIVLSQTSENTVLIDYGNCENETLSSKSELFLNFFGPVILTSLKPKNITENLKETSFILINNEFKYDTNVWGFEIYAEKPGLVYLQFVTFNECGKLVPCSVYFDKNTTFSSINYIDQKLSLNLKNGQNKYFINARKIPKGAVLVLENRFGKILTEQGDRYSISYADYVLNLNNSAKKMIKLGNYQTNTRFLINSIIEHGHYYDIIPLNKSYPIFYTYFTKIKLSKSLINIKARFDMVNGSSALNGYEYFFKETEFIIYNHSYDSCNSVLDDRFYTDLEQNCVFKPEFTANLDTNGLPVNQSSPKKFLRYNLLKFGLILNLNFIQKHIIKKSWTIYKMGSNNSFTDPPIKLENNPTVNYSQLIITSNILEYGVYKLTHWVYVKVDTGYLKDIPNEIEHFIDVFIQIVPGGIALFCLENGLDNIKIGKKQTLELNPIKYAYDMDFLVTANSLNYTFFCKQINSSQNIKDIRDIDFSESDDLLSFKYSRNSSLKNECFDSSDNLEFDSTGKILTIKKNVLKNLPNKTNLFIVITYHLSKLYYQFVRVEKEEIDQVPIASI
ncbi:unnamed protein product, partial [Brachionus calyciflorus]